MTQLWSSFYSFPPSVNFWKSLWIHASCDIIIKLFGHCVLGAPYQDYVRRIDWNIDLVCLFGLCLPSELNSSNLLLALCMSSPITEEYFRLFAAKCSNFCKSWTYLSGVCYRPITICKTFLLVRTVILNQTMKFWTGKENEWVRKF